MSGMARCQNNLKQIGIVMHLYRAEHDGTWPQTFAELYPEYISDLGVLICPSSNVTQGNLEDVASWASYEYTPYHGESAPATVVICRDKESFHGPGGKNELFADGHVAFKPDAEDSRATQ
jgi:prepilin-type processing-associated H-X9-DG protein